MKTAIVVLLTLIAAGVGYLALVEHRQHREAADVRDYLADPKAFVAKKWAEAAGVRCDATADIESFDTPSGIPRPVVFSCVNGAETLVIHDVKCPQGDDSRAGERTREGYYKPLSAICWDVAPVPR